MDLVQFLYLLLIYHQTGEYHSELKTVETSPKMAEWTKRIPELKAATLTYRKGEPLDVVSLANALRYWVENDYSKSPDAKATFIEVLKIFASWFKTGSEGALKKLEKLSAQTHDNFIHQYFVKEVESQGPIRDQLSKIVPKLGGAKGDIALDQEASKEARSKNPELYKQYLSLRKQYNQVWKDAVSAYVRSSGDKLAPYQDVLKFFKKKGIEHSMPLGFTGSIDANGAWYTADGKPINGTPSAVMFPTVRMNPNPLAEDWVFQARRPDGKGGNYFYTKEYKVEKQQEKFSKVADITNLIDNKGLRKKWLAGVQNFDKTSPKSVASVVIELLFQSSNRRGTPGGNKTTGGGFGICTLLKKHAYPQTNGGYKFIYQGKDNIKTMFKIDPNSVVNKKICSILTELLEGKKPLDPIFTYQLKNGSFKPIHPDSALNTYFKSISGGLTVHKLRSYWGTKIFKEEVATIFSKVKTVTSPKQAMELLKKAAVLVGKKLNHVRKSVEGEVNITPATALANYIDPGAQIDFFKHYGIPLPKYLENLTTANSVEDTVEPTEEAEENLGYPNPKLLEQVLVGDGPLA